MFFKKKLNWKKVAASFSEIPGSAVGLGYFDFEGRAICIASYNGRWHAFSGTCPHAGAPLHEGDLDARGQIICPVHGLVFNIQNGLNTSGEGYQLLCWPVEEREDGIYLGFK
jgi:nitrite reductase/ring-hydroxylating ferredoxin subunit